MARPHDDRNDDRSRTPLKCDLFARPYRLTVQPRAWSAGAQTVSQSRFEDEADAEAVDDHVTWSVVHDGVEIRLED